MSTRRDFEVAGVSDRTMRRIKQRYEEFGYDGLFDAARGLTPGEPLRRRPAA
jgi:hypothetical protein